MRKANCPSCGAPVIFRGAASIVAVCESCRSTLVRDGANIADIGKMAELVDDASPLALGADGRYKGTHFAIVGRIQYRYEAGVWNEWYCLFDDQRDGWLSDASGHYTMTFLAPPSPVPPFAALKPGANVRIGGTDYEVANIETSKVVAGAGELPFKIGAGWDAPVADLRDAKGRFATLDYSETPPMVYFGDEQPFDSFHFGGLRDTSAIAAPTTTKAHVFNCPSCGAPLSRRLDTTKAVGCGSCGAVIDVSQPGFAIIARAQAVASKYALSIPLGSSGRIDNATFEAVGYMRRATTADGQTYEWAEYLLHNIEQGYRWITEYQGHFSIVRDLAERPQPTSARGLPAMRVHGQEFRHFQSYDATVVFVFGEFYWRVKVGDGCRINDYVAPPSILSSEVSGEDATWSIGDYVEPDALWRMFALKTPQPRRVGVAPNQPSPFAGRSARYWAAFALATLAALAVHFAFRFGAAAPVLEHQTFTVQRGRASEPITTPAFEVKAARALPLSVQTTAGVDNSWLALDMTLVNENTGEGHRLSREIGYYHGVEDGESWSEGSRVDRARIADVAPGRYHLEIETEADPKASPPHVMVDIRRDTPNGWNVLIALGVLVLFPLFATWRASSFETQRWADSDHPRSLRVSGSSDDD